MPAYDIDFDQGEIDEVYFNGRKLDKPLQGSNGTWYENQFSIPIEWVKFAAARGENGNNGSEVSAPADAENEIRIDIDTNNQGWCTSIDWAEVHFKAMAPLLLIHGTGATPEQAWEVQPGVTNYLTSLGIPFEHRIQLGPNSRIFQRRNPASEVAEPGNAEALVEHIRANAASFGVQKVHLVAHSKGGLDSRGYISRYYPPTVDRVLSLHTLSTPHHGSVLADLSVVQRTYPLVAVAQDQQDVSNFLYGDWWSANLITPLSGFGPQRPALDDLRVGNMAAFNRDNPFSSRVKLYTYSADADLDDGCMNQNQSCQITAEESRPVVPDYIPDFAASGYASMLYRILRDVSSINIQERTNNGFTYRVDVTANRTTTPQLNDFLVNVTSSQHPSQLQHFGPFDRNHRNIKDRETMDKVLETIRTNFPVN